MRMEIKDKKGKLKMIEHNYDNKQEIEIVDEELEEKEDEEEDS